MWRIIHGPLFKITDQSVDPCLLLTVLLPTLQAGSILKKNDLPFHQQQKHLVHSIIELQMQNRRTGRNLAPSCLLAVCILTRVSGGPCTQLSPCPLKNLSMFILVGVITQCFEIPFLKNFSECILHYKLSLVILIHLQLQEVFYFFKVSKVT